MITNIYSADRCETGSRLLYFFSLLYLHSSTTTLPRLFLFSSCISNYASSSSASIPSAFSGCCFLTSSDSLSFLTAADSLSVPSSPSVRLRLRLQEDFCFPLTKPPSQRPEIRDGVLGLVPPLCVSFLLARPEETLQKERKQSRFSPPPSSPSPRNAAAPVSPLPIHPIMSPRFLLISCSTSVSS